MEHEHRRGGWPEITQQNRLRVWNALAAAGVEVWRSTARAVVALLSPPAPPVRLLENDQGPPPTDERLSILTSPHGPPAGTPSLVPLLAGGRRLT
ncbi:MAG TPA: hypothetical protein VGR26_06780 [Acidimicrobiales bacterium]|nr:hypothetical protein [Acidimicrobiales bacterium]